VAIFPASPVEPLDIPRDSVFIWQWDRHLESRHSLAWGYGLNETVTTVQRTGFLDAAGQSQPGSAVSSGAATTTEQA
jgi:hypothetical protein